MEGHGGKGRFTLRAGAPCGRLIVEEGLRAKPRTHWDASITCVARPRAPAIATATARAG